MRVLFLPENYYPSISGVSVVVKYLAEGLSRYGYDVGVATVRKASEPVSERINGVTVYRFEMRKTRLHRYVGDVRQYKNFVREYNPDYLILECSQCITTDTILSHLNYIPAKKVFHSHGFSGLELKPFSLKGDFIHTIGNTYNWIESQFYFKWKLKRVMPLFDATMCLSKVDSSIGYLNRLSKKNYILDNAADDIFFTGSCDNSNVLSKYLCLSNKSYFFSCANYSFIKNQKQIISEYFKSEASLTNSLVCIGGHENTYYSECKDLVKELKCQYGNRDVHLLCGVEREDIPSFYKNASIYLVASRQEQYSISIIEAMSQGLPFISTNVGNACVLPGGITVDDPNSIHSVVDQLIDDNDLMRSLSIKGKEYAYDNCRIDSVVKKLINIITEI